MTTTSLGMAMNNMSYILIGIALGIVVGMVSVEDVSVPMVWAALGCILIGMVVFMTALLKGHIK